LDRRQGPLGSQLPGPPLRLEGPRTFGDFSGVSRSDAAKPEASSVEFTIKVASIDTNEPKRDAHLKSPDFFDAEKNPEIRSSARRSSRRATRRMTSPAT